MIEFKKNWKDTNDRFDSWFHGGKQDRPLLNLWVKRETPFDKLPEEPYSDETDMYLNVDKKFAKAYNRFCEREPIAEAFPEFSMNLGAGSLALYLGCEPKFTKETVWFLSDNTEYDNFLPLRFDPNNKWFKKHIELVKRQAELVCGTDIMVSIPDLIENLDILASIRGSENCCYDIYDEPEKMKAALDDIANVYMDFYDAFYDIAKTADGRSSFNTFSIQGKGKTAKIQCDFAALMSPSQFDELVLPALKMQTDQMDNLLFHLDGPECICHVDSLMTLNKLGALQWTPGARNERGGDERWYPLYKKVRDAGKGVWIALYEYEPDEAIERAKALTRYFGKDGLYFLMPTLERETAERLMLDLERL